MPSEEELHALVGRRFPGGSYTIANWENRLLTEATGSAALPDGLAHPVHVFHTSMAGARTGVGDILELFGFRPVDSVVVVAYDWEFHRPLREGVEYVMSGGITRVERRLRGERIADHLFFVIDIATGDGTAVARITNEWRIGRYVP